MILLFFIATLLFSWEPRANTWVHNRRIIYITEFHILFHDGSILNRYHTFGTSSYILADKQACVSFYTTYRREYGSERQA